MKRVNTYQRSYTYVDVCLYIQMRVDRASLNINLPGIKCQVLSLT